MIHNIPDFEYFFREIYSGSSYKLTHRYLKSKPKSNLEHSEKINIPSILNVSYKFQKNKYIYKIICDIGESCVEYISSNSTKIDNLKCKIFKHILIEYFQFVCKRLDSTPSNIKEIGWVAEPYDYKFNNTFSKSHKEYILEDVNNTRCLFRNAVHKPSTEQVNNFLALLSGTPKLTSVFAYGLYSVSYSLFNSLYFTETSNIPEISMPFSLCLICKYDNWDRVLKISNAILNYTKDNVSSYRFNSVAPHFPLNSLDDNISSYLPQISDLPIIIRPTNENHRINHSSKYLKKIKKMRNESILKFFPVYLSSKSINDEYVINLDITDIPTFAYSDVSLTVETLVHEFIRYLAEMYNSIYDTLSPLYINYKKCITQDLINHSNLDLWKIQSYRDLLVSVKLFIHFLESIGFDSESYSYFYHQMYLFLMADTSYSPIDTDAKEQPSPIDLLFQVIKAIASLPGENITEYYKKGINKQYIIEYSTFNKVFESINNNNAYNLYSKPTALIKACMTLESNLFDVSYKKDGSLSQYYKKIKGENCLVINADIAQRYKLF